ncbi:AvrPphF family type III effector [Parendozoicomonas haliclonae]|uniref:Uncharacterized protein n=1 Tax=Parendozoicomonas haliclonae TaxID=1960125 RepID=A0A1X7AIP5_9GAMM|nr:hypothetical protein EHSB41UT_01737 [Parendozoicomonas haliclonae]
MSGNPDSCATVYDRYSEYRKPANPEAYYTRHKSYMPEQKYREIFRSPRMYAPFAKRIEASTLPASLNVSKSRDSAERYCDKKENEALISITMSDILDVDGRLYPDETNPEAHYIVTIPQCETVPFTLEKDFGEN